MFLLYYYIDNMHANKVSDFYDNLDKETKKEIHIAYEIINDPLGPPTKEFIKGGFKR
ncbi:hypothetical protein [Borreliella bavariensis]|uniref:hypothetical protein n=1 Tax=Borreliella bavariensis TaxID=664662 RepID=UPI001F1EC587|nr:hypothetical protein [Borreliella bavariensis]